MFWQTPIVADEMHVNHNVSPLARKKEVCHAGLLQFETFFFLFLRCLWVSGWGTEGKDQEAK